MQNEKIGVVVIHGASAGGAPTFSRHMAQRVLRKLGSQAPRVIWQEIVWSDILQDRQVAYLDAIKDKTEAGDARALVMAALSDAAAYRKMTDGSAAIYEQVHARVEVAMRKLEEGLGPDGQVLILAHALGGHIMSNYIYDLQKFADRNGQDRFGTPLQNMKTVAGVMTFGCNIPVFLFAYPPDDIRPIDYPGASLPEDRQIRTWWQNFYDKHDIMAFPMGSAAPQYAQMVADRALRDVPVHFGRPAGDAWDPLLNGLYWEDAELITPVAHYIEKMLA